MARLAEIQAHNQPNDPISAPLQPASNKALIANYGPGNNPQSGLVARVVAAKSCHYGMETMQAVTSNLYAGWYAVRYAHFVRILQCAPETKPNGFCAKKLRRKKCALRKFTERKSSHCEPKCEPVKPCYFKALNHCYYWPEALFNLVIIKNFCAVSG